MNRWRLLVVAALVYWASSIQPGWSANQVVVQSRLVAQGATGVQVGVYIDNDIELSALQVPLELRQLDPPSFPASGFTWGPGPAGRIQSSPLMQLVVRKFYGTPRVSNTCSGPVSHTWESGADTPGGTAGFYVSPDAILWVGIVMNPPPFFAPGTDGPVGAGTPSLLMTFDTPMQLGSFEIDTCCLYPNSHVAFLDNQTQEFRPQFTKGMIQVVQNLPPVAICQSNVMQAANQNCQGVVAPAQVNNGSYDPEDGTNVTLALVPAGPYPLGQTPVLLIVTDHWGAKDTCQSLITVLDVTPPDVTCHADTSITVPPGEIGALLSYTSAATDNCPGVSLSCTPPSGSLFPLGETIVSCIATDASGNADTCMFKVTVSEYACFDRRADLTCDGIINMQDVVEEINVAFRGKPESEVKPCTTPPPRR